MTKFCLILFVFLVVSTTKTTTLGFNIPVDVSKLAPKIFGKQLDFKVAFGSKENPFQIQNLHIELNKSYRGQPSQKRESSSGYYEARLITTTGDDDNDNYPYFINDKGLQKVTFDNGIWELQWPKKSPYGILRCSFDVPTTLKRNDFATLEDGRFWIHHRVWSSTSLESERKNRLKIQGEAAQFLKQRDEEVKKLTSQEESNNALKRMVSYGKAVKSNNDFRVSGLEEARYTPLYDDQVLVLNQQDCILSTRGLIYRIGGESVVHRELVYSGESRVDFPTTKNKNNQQQQSNTSSSDDSTTDQKEAAAASKNI